MKIDKVIAPHLKRRFPPEIRIRTYIVVLIFVFVSSASIIKAHDYFFPFYLTAIGLLPFFLVNHALDWGYQLASDRDRIYQRPKGWRWFFRRLPWYSIRYDEVRKIETIFGSEAAAKRHFFPFEFILVYGKTGAQGDNIVIHPPSFMDREIKAFLIDFYTQHPEIFPQDVIEYMHSDKPL